MPPVPTSFDQILLQVKAKLMDGLAWTAPHVLIIDPNDMQVAGGQADQYLMIWGGDDSTDRPIHDGAGRVDSRIRERLYVVLRTRLAVDEATKREKWMTHPSLGHWFFRHKILNALIAFQPTDNGDLTGATGNWLVLEPIAPVSGQKPNGIPKSPPGWGQSTLIFEAYYQLALDQTVQ